MLTPEKRAELRRHGSRGRGASVLVWRPHLIDLLDAADERDRLAGAVERVQKLAEGWHSRGEHLMAYSKTVPDEVADALLESGAEFVERARQLRNALDGSDD